MVRAGTAGGRIRYDELEWEVLLGEWKGVGKREREAESCFFRRKEREERKRARGWGRVG